MGTICRIYEQNNHGMKFIAQISGGRITGQKAASIRRIVRQFGFPNAPLEDVVDQLLVSTPGLGAAFIPQRDSLLSAAVGGLYQRVRRGGIIGLLFFWRTPRE